MIYSPDVCTKFNEFNLSPNFHNFNPQYLNNFFNDLNSRNKNFDHRFPPNFLELFNSKFPSTNGNLNPQKIGFAVPPSNNINMPALSIQKNLGDSSNLALKMVPPIRRTDPIIKKHVTLISNHNHKSSIKHKSEPADISHMKDKPKQLFWCKRNQGLRHSVINKYGKRLTSPTNLDSNSHFKMVGPKLDNEILFQNLISILYSMPTTHKPLFGQLGIDVKSNSSNIWAYLDTDQPLIEPNEVKDEDIKRQETIIFSLRKKLEKLINKLDNLSSTTFLPYDGNSTQ